MMSQKRERNKNTAGASRRCRGEEAGEEGGWKREEGWSCHRSCIVNAKFFTIQILFH